MMPSGNNGTTPAGSNNHQFIQQSQDLIGYKQSSAGPNTSMNFFKNNTQQVFLGQKSSTSQNANTNRKSQSTGRQGLGANRPSGQTTNNLQQQQLANSVNQSHQFQRGINQQIKRNNQIVVGGYSTNQNQQTSNINQSQVFVEPNMKQARYASQNQMRPTGPSDIATENPLHLNQQNSTGGIQPGSKKNLQNQSDIYKVYMNFVPSGQNSVSGGQNQIIQNQMAMGAGNTEINSRISPQKRSTSGNKKHNHQKQQNIVMKNRQNMLKSNKLQSNQKISSESNSKFNNTNQSLNNLPLIQPSLQNQNNAELQSKAEVLLNSDFLISQILQAPSTQTAVFKTNTLDQYGSVGAGRNSAINRKTNNLNAIASSTNNQHQQMVGITHHQRNNTSNQSGNVVVRGMAGINLMNYSILQSELDQETTSLEDMHMFFVAFNQRQNKIIQQIEKAEMVAMANDRTNLLFIDDDSSHKINSDDPSAKNGTQIDKNSNSRASNRAQGKDRPASKDKQQKQPMNVILLKKEVDLE